MSNQLVVFGCFDHEGLLTLLAEWACVLRGAASADLDVRDFMLAFLGELFVIHEHFLQLMFFRFQLFIQHLILMVDILHFTIDEFR